MQRRSAGSSERDWSGKPLAPATPGLQDGGRTLAGPSAPLLMRPFAPVAGYAGPLSASRARGGAGCNPQEPRFRPSVGSSQPRPGASNAMSPPPVTAKLEPSVRPRVLVVEDDRLNARILTGILKPEGY